MTECNQSCRQQKHKGESIKLNHSFNTFIWVEVILLSLNSGARNFAQDTQMHKVVNRAITDSTPQFL